MAPTVQLKKPISTAQKKTQSATLYMSPASMYREWIYCNVTENVRVENHF